MISRHCVETSAPERAERFVWLQELKPLSLSIDAVEPARHRKNSKSGTDVATRYLTNRYNCAYLCINDCVHSLISEILHGPVRDRAGGASGNTRRLLAQKES